MGWRAASGSEARPWARKLSSRYVHSRAGEPEAARQPILLTDSTENPNAAQALFIVDSAELGDTKGFDRCFIIFDGRNDEALSGARVRWKTLKDQGANLAYWKQSPEGRWEKAA